LRLAPDFGLAHSSSANLLSTADYDWNGALAEFRIALSLVPQNDPSHGAVSRLLTTLGKIDEAIRERRKYIDGDPLAGFAHVYLAQLQTSLGRLDEAEASLRKALEVDPENADWYAGERSYLAILRGDAEAARTEAMGEPPGHWRDRALTLALQIGNDRAAADTALQHLIETDGQAKGGAYVIAQVYALRGDADHAFEWLQRDWDRRDAGVYDVLRNPLLLRFRDDARFTAYCKTAGLPPPSASEALDIDRIRALLAKKSASPRA
jgi:tetratricopeptide (TPR) repeat protein